MRNQSLTTNPTLSVLLLLNRLALGLYFALAGLTKVRGGVGKFYHGSFAALRPRWLPEFLALPYGYSLPWLELLFGATLVLGWYTRISAWAVAAMLVSINLALLLADRFFDGPGPFHVNVMLLTLALLLGHVGGGALSVDALWRRGKRR